VSRTIPSCTRYACSASVFFEATSGATLYQRGEAMTLNHAAAAQRSKPSTVAERIVQALREAGYSCELADEAYSRNDVDLLTRH
jgi:hypothetical protein